MTETTSAADLFDWYPAFTVDKLVQIRADLVHGELVDGREVRRWYDRAWMACVRSEREPFVHRVRLDGRLMRELEPFFAGRQPYDLDGLEAEVTAKLNAAAERITAERIAAEQDQ